MQIAKAGASFNTLLPEGMAKRSQSTRLQQSFGQWSTNLEIWAGNPWRRLSLYTIVLLAGFLLGSAITAVAGVLGQLDPVAALVVVIGTEFTIRARSDRWSSLVRQLLTLGRIGFLYGLFVEGFKLL